MRAIFQTSNRQSRIIFFLFIQNRVIMCRWINCDWERNSSYFTSSVVDVTMSIMFPINHILDFNALNLEGLRFCWLNDVIDEKFTNQFSNIGNVAQGVKYGVLMIG